MSNITNNITNKVISKFMEWDRVVHYTYNLSELSLVWEKLGFNYEKVVDADGENVVNYNFISICKDAEGKFNVGFNYVVENRIVKNILDKGDTLEEAASLATRKVVDLEMLKEEDESSNS